METLGRSWILAHVLIDCDIPVADGGNRIWAIIEFQRNVFSQMKSIIKETFIFSHLSRYLCYL